MRFATWLAAALVAACGARDPFEAEPDRSAPLRSASTGGNGGCASCAGGAGAATAGGAGAGVAGCGGRPGPPMIAIAETRGVRCVDATEVSNLDYAAFLASAPSVSAQPSACADNAAFEPAFGWPAVSHLALPVVNVDWCDARAYCAWAGKTLCPGDRAKPEDATKSAWTSACSAAGARLYPYGDVYSKSACNGKELAVDKAENVGALVSCEGGYPGLFDMSGNVWEWEDACDGEGALATCLVRGGGFRNDALNVACRAAFAESRAAVFDDFGFRCCAP